jgi:hypothetical protein
MEKRESKLIKDTLHTIEYPHEAEVSIRTNGIVLGRLWTLLQSYLDTEENEMLKLFAIAQTNSKTRVDPDKVIEITDQDKALFLGNVETLVAIIVDIQDEFIKTKAAAVNKQEVELSQSTWDEINKQRKADGGQINSIEELIAHKFPAKTED